MLLAENGRLRHIDSIAKRFVELTMAHKGEVKAVVTTVIVSSSLWVVKFLLLSAYTNYLLTYIITIRYFALSFSPSLKEKGSLCEFYRNALVLCCFWGWHCNITVFILTP